METKLVRGLLPVCSNGDSDRSLNFTTLFCHSLLANGVSRTVRRVGTCFTSVPCPRKKGDMLRGVRGDRCCCRAVLCVILSVVGITACARMGDYEKETSTMVFTPATVFIFRVGVGGPTRRTLTRVGRGNCVVPCSTSREGVCGVNVDFDARAEAMRS